MVLPVVGLLVELCGLSTKGPVAAYCTLQLNHIQLYPEITDHGVSEAGRPSSITSVSNRIFRTRKQQEPQRILYNSYGHILWLV